MVNYDFSTLNSTDFEKLVCDLLNMKIDAINDTMFRSFKEGKDNGIDLLLSTKEKDLEVVVQIKHYNKSSFATLIRDLRTKEVEKVKKLNPNNYVFVTSLELSKGNKDTIVEIFNPYIKSLNDILGRDDLNDLLRRNKSVEERHFKLWFSSTIAIKKILQYKLDGRKNEFQESELKKRLRLFVSTSELGNAIRTLNANKFIIITGDPGVGKTTLSEILIYRFLTKDYDLTVIYDDIKEIELTLRDDDSNQIFYFDDFLGHTQAEISKSKSAETSLLKIISRIEKAENKFLILNTRKFILNSFIEESERFKNFNPLRSETKIELLSYTYGAKRRMLDNHIEEYDLDIEKKDILKKLSFFICDHRNFSPRHLEFYTNKLHIGNLTTNKYKNFIIDNLENPKKIWEHAYFNQISDLERFLLNTLYAKGSSCSLEDLEFAFNSRVDYEVKNNNYFKPINAFNDCLRKLNDGFLINFKQGGITKISLINPSLEDFLKYFIENNSVELERILFSSVNIDQWFILYRPFEERLLSDNFCFFLANSFINKITSDKDKYKLAFFLFSNDFEDLLYLCNLLDSVIDWEFISIDQAMNTYSLLFLKKCIKKETKKNVLIYKISKLNPFFFFYLILSCQNLEELYEMIFLLKNHFDFNFKQKFNNDSIFYGRYKSIISEIHELCKNLLLTEVESSYYHLKENYYEDEHIDILERISDYNSFIKNEIFENFKVDYEYLINRNWNEIANENYSFHLVNETQINSIGDNLSVDYSYYEDYTDYDFDVEKTNSTNIIDDYDDLPF